MNRFLVTALVIAIVAGCGSSGSAASPTPAATPDVIETLASVQPSVAPTVAATEPPTPPATPRPTPFPTAVFAALSDDPVSEDLAAKLQAALASWTDFGDGGMAATVMTPDGTWSGAVGKADGVHDLAVDSQFNIGSGTKPIIAAQVMLMVESGEISLDAPATDYLRSDFDFDFDSNGATIRQLLSHRSGIPDWYPAEPRALWRPIRSRSHAGGARSAPATSFRKLR
jgi:CubicO group peptidase (beta-lactamase class C family)